MAAEWMGWENVFQVEIDPFCQKVLEKNFPNTKRYGDIKEFDGTQYRGAIDILTGGFPCQPFSTAGSRRGTEDDRHLWPQMLRTIREVHPKFVVGENVYGMLGWSRGLVFEQVQADLETEGYQVTTPILPACSVGAPHRRKRLWFVAYRDTGFGFNEKEQIQTGRNSTAGILERLAAHSNGRRWIQDHSKEQATHNKQDIPDWRRFPNESPFRNGNDGIPANLVRRTIKAGGNAIVPQVAFEIFKAIEAVNNMEKES